jgi:protocatechuate 3,4-dioxygenase beta subunit
MSIKTSLLKRIAQSAVVALVGGLLSTVVAPAANAAVNASISASCVARAGVGGVIKVNVAGDNALVIRASMIERTLSSSSSSDITTEVLSTGAVDSATSAVYIPLNADTATALKATMKYQIWLDPTGSAYTTLASITGDVVKTTVTCTLAGAPASAELSASSASVGAGETATFTVRFKDTAGNYTLLKQPLMNNSTGAVQADLSAAAYESFTVTATTTSSVGFSVAAGVDTSEDGDFTQMAAGFANLNTLFDTATFRTRAASDMTSGAAYTAGPTSGTSNRAQITLNAQSADAGSTGQAGHGLGGESVTANGAYTIHVNAAAASTVSVAVAGLGAISQATGSFTLTATAQRYGTSYGFGTAATNAAAGYGIRDSAYATVGAAGSAVLGAGGESASGTYYVSTARTTIPLSITMSAAGNLPYTVAAVSTTSVTPSGITVGDFVASTTTETNTTITFTVTTPAAGQRFKVTWKDSAVSTITATFVFEAPGVDASRGALSLTNSGKVENGGTSSVTVTVTDQFASPVSGATVIWSRTGRNATLENVTATTNADGQATHTWTDAKPTSTTLTDVVSVRAAYGTAGTYTATSSKTFTYVAALTAGSITLINNGAAAGVAVDGDVLFTATVLDASGIALSSYPVVFTGDDETYYNTTNNSWTVYTDAAGVAQATFNGYKVGTATITAASGGKSATSSFTVLAGGSRAIAVDAATATMAPGESKRVTATVTDIYGNAVEDASVTVKYTGTSGRVASVNGVTAATGTADAAGQVVVELTADAAGTGTLTLTITAGNTSTLALTDKGSARPAKVTSVTTAVTISGTNATVAAAEAATDAAAEAIDAANAATDAANLAAEAADAATVAAEEARDAADAATAAVEELATQVATLMAALKAQITTLANTVAKIAKKVKA